MLSRVSRGINGEPMREVVARLSREAALDATAEDMRQAAALTGGLPVYADIGGVILLMPDGAVAYYDTEQRCARAVDDESWRTVAFVRAAKRYPELQGLHPARPMDACVCPQCAGAGEVVAGVGCGKCLGTGWVPAGSAQ